MRVFLLVLACAGVTSVVSGAGLGGAHFKLSVLLWPPFVLIVGAVLQWQWRTKPRETPLSGKPFGHWRLDDISGTIPDGD